MRWAVKPQAPQVLPQPVGVSYTSKLGPGARWVAPCPAHNPQKQFGSGVCFL